MVLRSAFTEGLAIQHYVFVGTLGTKWGFAWLGNDAFNTQCSRIAIFFTICLLCSEYTTEILLCSYCILSTDIEMTMNCDLKFNNRVSFQVSS